MSLTNLDRLGRKGSKSKPFGKTLRSTVYRVATGQFGIAAEPPVGKYRRIAKLPRHAQISYAFALYEGFTTIQRLYY